MKKIFPLITLLIFTITFALAIPKVFSDTYKHTFVATLSGSNEVSPVTTTMSGHGVFHINYTEDTIYYYIHVADGENITMAHLHCAPSGENGPVVVSLFNNEGGTDLDEGVLASGMLTVDDLQPAGTECSPNISTLPHLVQAMREGKIYLNVHTTQNPSGEVRGQLMIGSENDLPPMSFPVSFPDDGGMDPETPEDMNYKHIFSALILGEAPPESYPMSYPPSYPEIPEEPDDSPEEPPISYPPSSYPMSYMLTSEVPSTTENNGAGASVVGSSWFKVHNDEQHIDFKVELTNVANVTNASLICEAQTFGSAAVAGLFSGPSTNVNGVLVQGTLNWADLLPSALDCSPNIQTMPHLVQAMREGKIYIYIATSDEKELIGHLMMN